MPGKSTPVSSCAVTQLEITTNHFRKLFDSTQHGNALTLTIEGEKGGYTGNSGLFLLIHSGSRQILSIRLKDLLPGCNSPSQPISTRAQLKQLRIDIQEQSHVVTACFKHERNFTLAVYMLQKYGFIISDITESQPGYQSYDSQISGPTFSQSTRFGPRLSSITPLPGMIPPSQLGPQWKSSVTDLNPTSQLWETSSHPLLTLPEPWLGIDSTNNPLQSPSNQMNLASYAPQLNPYNVFLNKQIHDTYRPKVGSPLRNAVSIVAPQQPPRTLSQPLASQTVVQQSQSPISMVSHHADANLIWQASSNHSHSPTGHPPKSYSKLANSPAGISPSRYPSDSSIDRSPLPSNHFRELMPRPRSLPFSVRKSLISEDMLASDRDVKSPVAAPKKSHSGTPKYRKKLSTPVRDEIEPPPFMLEEPGTALVPRPTAFSPPPSSAHKKRVPPKRIGLKDTKRVNRQVNTKISRSVKKTPNSRKMGSLSPDLSVPRERFKEIAESIPKVDNSGNVKKRPIDAKKGGSPAPKRVSRIRPKPLSSPGENIVEDPPSQRKTSPSPTEAILDESIIDPASLQLHEPNIEDTEKFLPNDQSIRRSSRLASKRKPVDAKTTAKPPRVPKAKTRESLLEEKRIQPSDPHPASGIVQAENDQPESAIQLASTPTASLTEQDLAILVTDDTLRHINQATSHILDQYEADVKNNQEDSHLAQYYLDQLMQARNDLWQAELTKVHGMCLAVT